MAEVPSTLAVMLDCGPQWAWRPQTELTSVLEQLLTFLNAFQLLSASNELTVLAAYPSGVGVLWPPLPGIDAVSAPTSSQRLRIAVMAGMQRLLAAETPAVAQAVSNLP